MTTIIGLCGSLRRGSFNLMLLHAAVDAAPPGTSIAVESIREIPLYDGTSKPNTAARRPLTGSSAASLVPTACSSSLPSTTARCPAH